MIFILLCVSTACLYLLICLKESLTKIGVLAIGSYTEDTGIMLLNYEEKVCRHT